MRKVLKGGFFLSILLGIMAWHSPAVASWAVHCEYEIKILAAGPLNPADNTARITFTIRSGDKLGGYTECQDETKKPQTRLFTIHDPEHYATLKSGNRITIEANWGDGGSKASAWNHWNWPSQHVPEWQKFFYWSNIKQMISNLLAKVFS